MNTDIADIKISNNFTKNNKKTHLLYIVRTDDVIKSALELTKYLIFYRYVSPTHKSL